PSTLLPHFRFSTHPPTTQTYTLSLHDALPISFSRYQARSGRLPSRTVHAVLSCAPPGARLVLAESEAALPRACFEDLVLHRGLIDRKSTRLNSSHVAISYAVFCLKKKKKN